MERIVDRGLLYDFYGSLLTEKQRALYEDAVYRDLSLTEIGEKHGITKQGVSDALTRATKTLESYETRLHMIRRYRAISALCDDIEKACAQDAAQSATRASGNHAAGKTRGADRRPCAESVRQTDELKARIKRNIGKIRRALA